MGALLVFVVVGPPTSVDLVGNVSSRMLAAGAFVVLLVIHSLWRYVLPQVTSRRRTVIWPLPEHQVNVLQRSAGRFGHDSLEIATSAQIQSFIFALIHSARVRQRITERYTPAKHALQQRVTLEVQLPDHYVRQVIEEAGRKQLGGTATIPLPIIVSPKGQLIDNLRVTAADGSELPVLPYRQYLQLVARALRTLLQIAYQGEIDGPERVRVWEAERTALALIMKRGDGDVGDESGSMAIRRLKTHAYRADVAQPPPNPAACEVAADLVGKLTSHYATVVMVPVAGDSRFVVTYERLTSPPISLGHGGGVLGWVKRRLRVLLGVSPGDVEVHVENAPTAQSYHLIVDGGEGVYLGRQEAPGLVSYVNAHGDRLRREYLAGQEQDAPPPYFRFRSRTGQSYAHFYARFFPQPAKGQTLPHVRFRFFEVPPGSVFRAAITAWAAAIFIWIFGLVSASGTPANTDAPAYLLAFPALAGGWLGYESHRAHRMIEGALAASQSLIWTVLLSIGASGLFLAIRTDATTLDWQNPYGLSVVGVTSLPWSVVMLGSLLNAVSIGYIAIARAWEYHQVSLGSRRSRNGRRSH